MSERKETCGNCRYWLRDRSSTGAELRSGKCRRRPPTLLQNGRASFPFVEDYEWCGEWFRGTSGG